MHYDAIRSVRRTYTMTDTWVARAAGSFLDSRHYDDVLSGVAVDVYKPNGSLLLSLRPGTLPTAACLLAYKLLLSAARQTNKRPIAAGGAKKFHSGTIGYLHGKVTAFTRDDPDGWGRIQPLLHWMDAVLRRERPAEYAVLRDAADRTPPGLVVPGTSFTTVTANRTARTATTGTKGTCVGGMACLPPSQRASTPAGCSCSRSTGLRWTSGVVTC